MMNRVSISLLVAACLVVAACSSERTKSPAGAATTTSTIAIDATTTVAADATTTTIGGDATTSVAPAPTTTLSPPQPADDDPTAWTSGSEEGDPEVSAAPGVCEPFYDAIAAGPYTVQRCGVWNAVGGQRMWTVTKGASGRFFAIVWQQNAPNNWVPRLRALEEAPGAWSDIVIRTGNYDAGANDELVSGVRIAGTGGFLDVSIIDIRSGNPRVMAVLNGNTQGVAVPRANNGVEVWAGNYGPGDPGCCPSTFTQTFVSAVGGDWFVTAGATLPAGDPGIPLSEF